MKKIIYFIIEILLIFSLLACSKEVNEPKLNENTICIPIYNNSSNAIYGIYYEYYIDEKELSLGKILNANDSLIKKGDMLPLVLTSSDFPADTDLTVITIDFFVILDNNEELSIEEPIDISLDYGINYYLSLTGDRQNGFNLLKIEKNRY